MGVKDAISRKLTDGLAPVSLSVVDESDQHRGHGGWREGGETHFRVEIVSAAFEGKNRVARQRLQPCPQLSRGCERACQRACGGGGGQEPEERERQKACGTHRGARHAGGPSRGARVAWATAP